MDGKQHYSECLFIRSTENACYKYIKKILDNEYLI